jgi:peroxiredoxin
MVDRTGEAIIGLLLVRLANTSYIIGKEEPAAVMVEEGDSAPTFTAPLVDGDEIGPFSLGDALGNGPVVLAFFPGAFTGVCTDEMCTFRDNLSQFDAVDATVFGISVDTPFSLQEFQDKHDINFGLFSDSNKEIIDDYDIEMDFEDFGYYGVAKRSVFVLDDDGTVIYKWVTDDPHDEPDYDAVADAAADA